MTISIIEAKSCEAEDAVDGGEEVDDDDDDGDDDDDDGDDAEEEDPFPFPTVIFTFIP